ncbi:MAG: methyl-accepting chemotaxis protein [Treponema sp.]|jgi:methyl-accepting chemotaxis protein|nr:methyl-accepting chemotaxis protein [Treponema sp.]
MRIGVKLVVIISILNVIGIGILAGITVNLSQREISRMTNEHAVDLAIQAGEKISKWLGEYMDISRTLAQLMEGYKRIPIEARRDQINFLLRQVAVANPHVSSWATWGPNMLDGMDEQYIDTLGTAAGGRFSAIWYGAPWEGATEPLLDNLVRETWEETIQDHITIERALEPFVFTVEGENHLSTSMSVPIMDNGAIVGYTGLGFGLSQIQDIAEEIKPFGDGFVLVFSHDGLIAAHSDPSRLGKNIRESETDTFGPFLDTMINVITQGTRSFFSYRSPQSDTAYHYYSTPLAVGRALQPWTLVIGVSRNTVMAPVYHMIRICLIIGILTMLLMSAGVVFMARSISRPIARTMTVLKDIAEGDLTKEIAVSSKDEVGDLARYLNFTVDKIKNLVLSIRREADTLSQTSMELASNMTQTATSIVEITASVQNVKGQTGKQVESVKSADASMDQAAQSIESLKGLIQKQTDCVNQSSSAIEEMLANIQSVTQTLVNNEGTITELAEASEIGRQGLQEVSGDIREIAKESAGLMEINAVIQNIASQTNLLSMNAAIEAAHAGDAGKGFAVVADEIRKLAESSSEQSKMVSGVLKRIKESIDKITKSTEGVLLKFEAISGGVEKVTEQDANVRAAMEEQGQGSKSILEAVGNLNDITGAVKSGSEAVSERYREVMKESRVIERITGEISGGMQEMAAGAEQINSAVTRVREISGENKEQIGTLRGEVSRFKVV